jgi:hypothetical protein
MADVPAAVDLLFDSLVVAMNDPSRAHVAAAFTEDAVIDRYDADAVELVDRHRGYEEIERWLRRTPAKYKFARVGEVQPRPASADDESDAAEILTAAPAHDHAHDHAHPHPHAPDVPAHAVPTHDGRASSYRASAPIYVSEYAIRSDDFENGGHWHLQHAPDGRITWMRHHPRALRL